MQQALTFPAPRRPALLVGLAISALLHALLLLYVRLPPASPALPDTRRWSQPLTVRLVPPAPPPVSQPVPEPKAAPATTTTPRPARPRSAPPQAIAVAPERSMPAATAPASAPAAEPAPQESRLNLDAARASARGLARDLPTSDNWAAEKLAKERGLQDTQDEKLGKNIARSARPDCRNSEGGLLAPLLWMMDKKDSGCKF